MKNLYIKIVKYFVDCLTFILGKTMLHLVWLSEKKNISQSVGVVSVSKDYFSGDSVIKTFSHMFSRVKDIDLSDDTGKGITIAIPRVIIPKKENLITSDPLSEHSIEKNVSNAIASKLSDLKANDTI